MNKTLAEFLVADGRPKATKNYPEVCGFLYAFVCAPEIVEADVWLPMVFNHQDPNYQNKQEQGVIEQGLLDEFLQIKAKIENAEPVLAAYFRPSDELMENFDEDSPIAHWGRGFIEGHQYLCAMWDAYFPQDQKDELLACLNIMTFFADKSRAEADCRSQNIEGLELDIYAESVISNFDEAAQGYAHYGLTIRAALEAYQAKV